METENTPQEKAKFFAQYWGQKLLLSTAWEECNPVVLSAPYFEGNAEGHYITLTPLKNISDKDAIELGKLYFENCFGFKTFGDQMIISYYEGDNISEWVINLDFDRIAIDFLRSKSYLLPYKDLSTEDLIAYGWAKEIES